MESASPPFHVYDRVAKMPPSALSLSLSGFFFVVCVVSSRKSSFRIDYGDLVCVARIHLCGERERERERPSFCGSVVNALTDCSALLPSLLASRGTFSSFQLLQMT